MKIGSIGAGHLGGGLALVAVAAGHEVRVSNSRDPRTLFTLDMQLGRGQPGRAVTPEEAARFGDVVVLAIPFYACKDLPVDALAGKIVIDTVNYFAVRDGDVPEIDDGSTTSGELIAKLLPSAKVTRAFNTLNSTEMADDAKPKGTPGRRAVPVAGDDAQAKAVTSEVVDSLGFDPVDIGGLAQGRETDHGGPLFNINLDVAGVRKALAA